MTTLRIKQTTESTGRYRVELSLDGDGLGPQDASVSFQFEISPQDQEDLRWYLEDYLQFPHDPAPTIAARIEQRMKEIGTELFKAVFDSCTQATRLWASVYDRASDLRVEIVTSVREAAAIPWELLRDPHTDTVLALRAAAFVRTHREASVTPKPLDATSVPIRILLVICRPKQADDVPFRSVASRLVKALTEDARAVLQIDVLRPPTYDEFAKTLRQAKREGRPYHVVHFDGHGMYGELSEDDGGEAASAWLKTLIPLMLSGPREGSHGYLLFENPANDQNLQLVDGDSLGKLLYETNTPVLVLNACRSAHADVAERPEHADSSDEMHAQVRAFGSLAQVVIDAGVTGVVAMRYNVYVVTAAQFVADLYAALAQGNTLGEAVTLGRKQLRDNPDRTIAFAARSLQDWCVPLVYEALPTALFEAKAETQLLSVKVGAAGSSSAATSLDRALPVPPDVGFFGRDETLLALDRAFDTQPIVLLHAYAGSGKTATAAEFARWYSLTGGVAGPVLFTSFERHQPLARVVDRVGEVFAPLLKKSGVNWLALNDDDRRDAALQVLNQIPLMWIWDNVELVAGFPVRRTSDSVDKEDGLEGPSYSQEEQQELVDFLRDAAQTKAKFLLTSRRDEREWLGDNLPCRVTVPPMPMQERVQLAQAIAERQRRKLTDVDDWRPLLRFTAGNPLTVTALVGQALRDGLKTRAQIEAFVEKLRNGEAAFHDDPGEGRDRSLAASLSYGFEHAFDENQRRTLALLHFFQGFVDVTVLQTMGDPEADWSLSTVRGLSREAGIALLDRAAEVGLLTALGGGTYSIHPVLPWFFKNMFDEYYRRMDTAVRPDAQDPSANVQERPSYDVVATHAFVKAIGELGNLYHNEYGEGHRDVISALAAEEANLIQARRLARSHGWWQTVIYTMQGLQTLYDHTGRRAEWSRLVNEITAEVVAPETDGALPGREEQWRFVTEYRVGLARHKRQRTEAERLQQLLVDWDRLKAEKAVQAAIRQRHLRSDEKVGPETKPKQTFFESLSSVAPHLTDIERNSIRALAVSMQQLGNIQRERMEPSCIKAYEESLAINESLSNSSGAARTTYNLGLAYLELQTVRNLERAEHWLHRSLELHPEHDELGRARCHIVLGTIALERFRVDTGSECERIVLLEHLNTALRSYRTALELLPANAVNDLAIAHNQIGGVYTEVGDNDAALSHYREAIRYHEGTGNLYLAAETRGNVAVALAQSGRLAVAREYAVAALRNFQHYGEAVADKIESTQQLIADIDRDLDQQNE